jgi:hypothetical protein
MKTLQFSASAPKIHKGPGVLNENTTSPEKHLLGSDLKRDDREEDTHTEGGRRSVRSIRSNRSSRPSRANRDQDSHVSLASPSRISEGSTRFNKEGDNRSSAWRLRKNDELMEKIEVLIMQKIEERISQLP